MRVITKEQFEELLKAAHVRPRLRRELKFVPDIVQAWESRELLAVSGRAGRTGVLLIELGDELCVLAYELSAKLTDKATGRSRSVTCDICYTWQRGDNAGRITFQRAADGHKVSLLCCADLHCSLHVRGLTPQAVLSRTQLHEDMTAEQRITRLQRRLAELTTELGADPVLFA